MENMIQRQDTRFVEKKKWSREFILPRDLLDVVGSVDRGVWTEKAS